MPPLAPKHTHRGAIGGAANEDGADFRASVAAWAVAFGLAGRPLPCIDSPSAIPISVSFETDNSVDDIEVVLKDNGRVFIQSKLSVNISERDKELHSVISQWCNALRNDEVDPDKDRVLLAVKRSTNPIRALSAGLMRAKASIAGSPNSKEAAALRVVSAHCVKIGFTDEHRLWKVAEVHAFSAEISIEAVSVLAGGVIASPEMAEEAWRILKETARELARNRRGLTIREWADQLSRRNIEFACDAGGTPAAQIEATRLALRRYRDRLIERASKMDLRGLGAPLPVFDHSPQKVKPVVTEGDITDSGTPLASAFQRLGRILLLGLPGGGKTTALTHLAATLANSDDAPLPVVVRVIEWWRLLEDYAPLDALVELVIREAPPADRPLLANEIHRRAMSGELAVLLDGLDEARERRFAASIKVDDLQKGVHPDVDFLLTTRDSGYSAAKTLPFRAVTLLPPTNLEYTVGRIIAVAAEQYAPKISDRHVWEKQRTDWVASQIERDKRLRETPLIQVLLAVLAGDPSREKLPVNRAQVLNEVVIDLLNRWEITQRRCGSVRLGSLEGTLATSALRESYAQIGFLLLRSGTSPRAEIASALGQWLASRWGLASGPADSTASEILHFWDECGVFVGHGFNHIIQPRIALLAEMGTGLYLIALPPDKQQEAVKELEMEPTTAEAITLAALMSPAICEIAVSNAISSQRFDRQILACKRLLDGGTISNATADSLALGLSKFSREVEYAWAAANAIAQLSIAYQSKLRHLEPFEGILSSRQYRLVLASAAVFSGVVVLDLERVLADACEEMRPRPRVSTEGRNVRPNHAIYQLVSNLADSILPVRPDLAEAFSEAGNLGSVDLRQRIDKALLGIHRADIVHKRRAWLARDFSAVAEEFDQAWRDFLRTIASQAKPRQLSVRERRRLDDLADFIATLEYGETSFGELGFALRTVRTDLEAMIKNCILLGGFDSAALATEASIALAMEEESHDSKGCLFFGAKKRPTTRWDLAIDKLQTIRELVGLLGSTHWIAQIAAEMLSSCPLVQEVVEGIDDAFDAWQPFNRLIAGELLMRQDPDWCDRAHRWKSMDDPIARRLAAKALVADHGAPLDELLELALTDPDAWVRTTAVDALSSGKPDELVISRLREAAATPQPGFLCIWCGKPSAAGTKSCSHCKTTGPDFASSIAKLLADISSRPLTPSRSADD
jgi:hypothetical protein